MLETSTIACPVCSASSTVCFHARPGVPCRSTRLWATRDEARAAACGDIELMHCRACGHVFNSKFDPSKVVFDVADHLALGQSPAYAALTERFVAALVERHGLRGKTVLEIGCGKADFLKAICLPFGNRGVGYDPAFTDDCLTDAQRETIHVTADRYTPASGAAGDLVLLRSVLQIATTDPRAFLEGVRPAVRNPDGAVYAEVPGSAHVFERLGVWNIVYENGSFYGKASLTRLFETCGFAVKECFACGAEDENVGIEAGVTPGSASAAFDPADAERFAKVIDRFQHEHQHKTAYWQHTLDRLATQGKRISMWGAGARAQSFCNYFDLTDRLLPTIVDINPHRQGKFLPKTLQQVVPPEQLQADPPDVVLITHSGYAPEIRKQIDAMGVRCEIMVLD